MKYSIYDCRVYCLNLKSAKTTSSLQGHYAYFCNLTGNCCVGSKSRLFGTLNDELNVQIVERCPARKTINDLIRKFEANK